MKKILIIDDEQDLCNILLYNLKNAGYEVSAAYSAEEALKRDIISYDLLLLDVMLPGMSGFELAKLLNKQPETSNIPIIFLTAKDTEDDMLCGFNIGADDYIAKPFSVREVLARIKAVLNRIQPANTQEELVYKGLHLNMNNKNVTVDGKSISCTPTEFHLLTLFLQEPGNLFSREELLRRVWPSDVIVTDRAVDVNITRLRKKIGRYAANIITRQGFGYYFNAV